MRAMIWKITSALTVALLSAAVAADPPVATVGSHQISRADLENHVRAKLIELDNQRYEALSDGLDEMVADELLKQEAKARGVTVEVLSQQEIEAKVAAPTDAEIQQVYDANKEQLGGATLDSVKPRIVEFLKQQKTAERTQAYIAELKPKYKTTVLLRPPVVQVGTGGRPERGGGANAPVTIIAFSDYECPFCKRAEVTVAQVMSTYGNKVRYVHRDFPLSFHAHAREAAEAANCAAAQGKFWPYHDKLFASEDLSTDKLKALATEVGLDRTKFDDCLAKQEFNAAIDKDVAEGSDVGVNGTPAFFINGRMLSGAQPFEKFKEVIDEEIELAPKPKS
jgi:protein-disulfide isomerase